MTLTHSLRTPRLRIEPVTRDLSLVAILGRGALEQALGVTVDPDWREDHVFRRSRIAIDDRPQHALVILAAEERLIGEVRFEPLRERGGFEIGYAIVNGHRRRGYAVEATAAVIDVLETGGANAIIAGCSMDNLASVRTLRRLGFELDGSVARTRSFWWARPRGGPSA